MTDDLASRHQLHGLQPALTVADVKAAADYFVRVLGFELDFLYGDPPCPSPQSSPRTVEGSRGSEWQANTPIERMSSLVGDGDAQWLTAGTAMLLAARAHALHDETAAMDLSSGIVRPRDAKRSDDEARRGEAGR